MIRFLAWWQGMVEEMNGIISSSEKINGMSPPQDIEEGLLCLIAKLDGTLS